MTSIDDLILFADFLLLSAKYVLAFSVCGSRVLFRFEKFGLGRREPTEDSSLVSL